jgi:hypothetical protein
MGDGRAVYFPEKSVPRNPAANVLTLRIRAERRTPLLRSPKRKLRETAFVIPEMYSLGSRLGLLGIRFRLA